MYNNIKEVNSQENRIKMMFKIKNKKLNKKEKYEKDYNINTEVKKKEKNNIEKSKMDKKKKSIKTNKDGIKRKDEEGKKIYKNEKYYKFHENYYISNFIENKDGFNLNIKRSYLKYNQDKYNKIFIIYFYLFIMTKIFFERFIECNFRKIQLASSYIKLKTNGTGYINILNENFFNNNKPVIISINYTINYTNNDINYKYNLSNEINEIILIWNKTLVSTSEMFQYCKNITEIDLSNFDTSCVRTMSYMFSSCLNLTSLDLSNFNTSSVTTMSNMFVAC